LEAVLTALHPVHKSVGDRRQVRVCPKRPIQGDLITSELSQSYRGELADLSRDGLAIYLPARYFYPRIYQPGARLSLALRLPVIFETGQGSPAFAPFSQPDPLARFDRSELRFFHLPSPASAPNERRNSAVRAPLLQVQGTIANTIDEPSFFRVRIGVSIFPNDPSRPVIARFIAQRQSEILRELKAVSDLFY
jgi:hypothetical protein